MYIHSSVPMRFWFALIEYWGPSYLGALGSCLVCLSLRLALLTSDNLLKSISVVDTLEEGLGMFLP